MKNVLALFIFIFLATLSYSQDPLNELAIDPGCDGTPDAVSATIELSDDCTQVQWTLTICGTDPYCDQSGSALIQLIVGPFSFETFTISIPTLVGKRCTILSGTYTFLSPLDSYVGLQQVVFNNDDIYSGPIVDDNCN